jgi:hypothetical protein
MSLLTRHFRYLRYTIEEQDAHKEYVESVEQKSDLAT